MSRKNPCEECSVDFPDKFLSIEEVMQDLMFWVQYAPMGHKTERREVATYVLSTTMKRELV